ncbi:YihY/virulence factor BrkB family protein [Halococcus sp. PRR34]|nr:YihY/virulence factor BrkB family protein [Halococcus sp. PRR34]
MKPLTKRIDESRFDRPISIVRAIVHELRTEKVTFMAGSIAYHAFVSMLPLLVLVLTIISTVGDRSLETAFVSFAERVLTPSTGGVLIGQLETAGTSTGLSILGLGVLLWGTLRIFRGLDTAFSDIYETGSANTFTDQLTDGVVVFLTFGLALVAGWAINSILSSVDPGVIATIIRPVVLIIGLAITFVPMYYIFPDTDVTLGEILPGVFVTAVGLTAFESVFRLYTQFKSPESSAIAGVLVLLTWLYFSGLIILVGVAVNAVLSNRSADVDIEPVTRAARTNSEGKKSDTADRQRIVEAVSRAERTLSEGGELKLVTNENDIRFPSPHRVVASDEDTESPADSSVSLELHWDRSR